MIEFSAEEKDELLAEIAGAQKTTKRQGEPLYYPTDGDAGVVDVLHGDGLITKVGDYACRLTDRGKKFIESGGYTGMKEQQIENAAKDRRREFWTAVKIQSTAETIKVAIAAVVGGGLGYALKWISDNW